MLSLADEIINQHSENVRQILLSGIDVNQLDEYGFTPLIETAIADDIDMAREVIAAGADVNLQDITGGSALHWAAENENLALCELLLTHGANPNAYTFAGQPVLVMPLLRHQQSLKTLLQSHGADLSFAQDFINTKMLGHMFELVGTADLIDLQNNFVEIDFEGFYLESSLAMITDSLAQFSNHFAARNVRRFAELTQIIIEVLERADKLLTYLQYRTNRDAHTDTIDALIRHEPLILPIGYEGHAITFVKLGNIIAKCDRREMSRLYDNIVLYHIEAPENATLDFLKQIIYEKKSDQFVNTILPEYLQLKPMTELKVEAQISGNCSWANVEATIPTLFFLLLLASSEEQKNSAHYKTLALNFFQQWREWNKDRALQFCIQSFKDSDTLRNLCKAEILAAILFQCCRYERTADRERIESILAVLTQPEYVTVLQNYIQIYCYESQNQEGKDFLSMLKLYGVV